MSALECFDCGRPAVVLLAHTDAMTSLCGEHATTEINEAVADRVLLVMTRTGTEIPASTAVRRGRGRHHGRHRFGRRWPS